MLGAVEGLEKYLRWLVFAFGDVTLKEGEELCIGEKAN